MTYKRTSTRRTPKHDAMYLWLTRNMGTSSVSARRYTSRSDMTNLTASLPQSSGRERNHIRKDIADGNSAEAELPPG